MYVWLGILRQLYGQADKVDYYTAELTAYK